MILVEVLGEWQKSLPTIYTRSSNHYNLKRTAQALSLKLNIRITAHTVIGKLEEALSVLNHPEIYTVKELEKWIRNSDDETVNRFYDVLCRKEMNMSYNDWVKFKHP